MKHAYIAACLLAALCAPVCATNKCTVNLRDGIVTSIQSSD
jgi:hypothetical protein